MAVTRISTYAFHQNTLSNASRLQANIFESQTQLSSGLRARNFEGLNGSVELYATLEDKLGKSAKYIVNNRVLQARLDDTNNALSQIIDLADSLKNLLLQRRNSGVANDLAFQQQMEGGFKTLAGLLNSNIEGRYLFAGSRTDQKPVDEDTFPTLVETGQPDSGYYLGSKEDITARIDDGFELTYNVRADASGFQQIVAAIATGVQGHQEGKDELIERAFDLMSSGMKEVINVQASVNSNYGQIDKASSRLTSLSVYWRGLKEDTVNADIVGLSTQLAVDQGVLQATFQTFAKINSLKLSDFL